MTNKFWINSLRTSLILLTFLLASRAAAGAQTGRQLIYDGRADAGKSAPLVVENRLVALVESEVKQKATLIKEKSGVGCDEDGAESKSITIIGAANGSFTRTKSTQKAILYELCRSGRSYGIGGIIIVENGKIAAHRIYGENGLSNEIRALSDINQNGLSELLLVGGGTGQGYTNIGAELIEFETAGVRFFGIIDVYDDNFGTGNQPARANAYKISVAPGTEPVFYREIYRQNSNAKNWILVKKSVRFSPRNDVVPKYHRVD